MGATNISTKVKERASNARFEQPFITELYTIDFLDSEFSGITTQATHNLVPIPAGYALVAGCGIVTTSFDSSGDAVTLQFKVGSDTLTGALPQANLTAGDMFRLLFANSAATETKATYAVSADTLDVAVAAADVTAGKIVLMLHFLDVATVLAAGKIKP